MTPKQVWSALSDGRKDELLSDYRDVNVEDGLDWWDGVYESFIEDCKEKGIGVSSNQHTGCNGRKYFEHDICFSGFWGRGDGAAFGGFVADWAKVLTALGKSELIKRATSEGWSFDSTTRSNNNMSFRDDFPVPDNPYDEDEEILQHDAWNIGQPSQMDLDALSSALQEMFNDLATKLYEDLEAEHDYLTSDECITEYILDHVEIEEIFGDEEIELPEGPAEVDPRQPELAF